MGLTGEEKKAFFRELIRKAEEAVARAEAGLPPISIAPPPRDNVPPEFYEEDEMNPDDPPTVPALPNCFPETWPSYYTSGDPEDRRRASADLAERYRRKREASKRS